MNAPNLVPSRELRDTCAIVGTATSRLGRVPGTSSLDLMVEAIRKARGVIAEEEGRQSHAAVIAERLGVPVIVGVANATADLREGEMVTLELQEGVVHRGALGEDHTAWTPVG